jgi:hypothetical protein
MERTRIFYAAQGYSPPYRWAHNERIPFSPLKKDLSTSKIAVIITSVPHSAAGKPREVHSLPTEAAPESFHTSELAWDKESTHTDDLGSYFPLKHLQTLVSEGRLGSIADRFHCVPTEYSHRKTQEMDAPLILSRCIEDEVDVVMLVPL